MYGACAPLFGAGFVLVAPAVVAFCGESQGHGPQVNVQTEAFGTGDEGEEGREEEGRSRSRERKKRRGRGSRAAAREPRAAPAQAHVSGVHCSFNKSNRKRKRPSEVAVEEAMVLYEAWHKAWLLRRVAQCS